MELEQFQNQIEQLTPKQRKVLTEFLAGKTDNQIANTLNLEASTIRRHITNICKAFGLSNNQGEHYSYRDELIALFRKYQPEKVNYKFKNTIKRIKPKFPDSPLKSGSFSYISRPPIETRCTQEVLKSGALIRIRGSQGMGKTSLLNLILNHAQNHNHRVISLNLRQADNKVLTDLDLFLRWFALNISHRLNIVRGFPKLLLEDWDSEYFGSVASCTIFFQTQILEKIETPIVIALDNLDWLFEFPVIAQGFFPMLRSWHEEANSLAIWQKLKLIVAYSTEVYIPLNINQSPFNVGLPIKLSELTFQGVLELADKYNLNWSIIENNQLMKLIGGHPYLVQLAFYHLQNGDLSLEELLELAPTQSGIYNSILRKYWQILEQHIELKQALKTILKSSTEIQLEPSITYKLESMGLVKLEGNYLKISCDLYRQYFQFYLM